MSAATNRVRQVILVFVLLGLGAFVVMQVRNYMVKRTYKGQVQDIQSEMRIYKGLSEINTKMWSSDKELKELESLEQQVVELNPATDELKKSRKLLMSALENMRLAQQESGITVSALNLDQDQSRFPEAKAKLEKANTDSSSSGEYLEQFEKAHPELFQ